MIANEEIKRFQTRMPVHILDQLKLAAGLTGATINQFIVQAALEKAQQLIEKEHTLELTLADAKVFFDAIENPPAPNEELLKLAEDYRKDFPDDEI